MRNRTMMIAAAAAVTAALAAGSTVAVASATGGKPGAPEKTMSASEKPGHDAMVAAVAEELHVGTARVSAALQPLFAAGHADSSSPAFAAAARALGVSTEQLNAALVHAKQSLAAGQHATQGTDGTKKIAPGGSRAAEERQGHDAMVAAVAEELHVGTARVSAALQPLFAAGHADTSSPAFAVAARALGVSTEQLNAALVHAKQSLAQASSPS
jgi:2-hydroxychromene-2-carboxylate isomerase